MDSMDGWGMGIGWCLFFVIAVLVVVVGIFIKLRKK